MRTAATLVISIPCVSAFIALLASHSVLSYVTSPEAVTRTAQRSDLYDLVLRASQEVIADEMRNSPDYSRELEALIADDVHAAMARVFPEDWFYDNFAAGYRDVTAILADEDRELTTIDLRGKKDRLADELAAISDRVAAECTSMFGADACADDLARARAAASYRGMVARAVASLPDHIGLESILAKAQKDWLATDSHRRAQVVRAVAAARIIRYAALIAVALCLLIVLLINLSPRSRSVASVCAVALACSTWYLLTIYVVAEVAIERIRLESLPQRAGLTPRPDELGTLAVRAAETMAENATHDALHSADTIAIAIGLTSGIALVVAFLLGRRR